MAKKLGITLVALARSDSMIVFTHGERLGRVTTPAYLQHATH
jgi:formate dehydrogenase assembly factor FdhD